MVSGRKVILMRKYRRFCKENPLEFTGEQLGRIEADIRYPRKGVVSDEYVDFWLWKKGLKSRQEYFAEYVENLFPAAKYQKLLEVGCGGTARLSKLLTTKGYKMSAMDPQICPESVETYDISWEKEAFIWGKTDIIKYDGVVAQEPCDATEHIIRECVAEKKDFIISLCGTAHRPISGEMPEDLSAWYRYLEEIGGGSCCLVNSEMIPGYVSYIMIGIFREKHEYFFDGKDLYGSRYSRDS